MQGALVRPRLYTAHRLALATSTLLLALCLLTGSARADAFSDAVALHRDRQLDEAYQQSLALIERGALEAAAYHLAFRIARDGRQLDDFEQFLRRRLRYGKDLATAEWMLGRVSLQNDRFNDALPHLARAIRFDPEALPPYIDLADAHLALGHRSLGWLDRLREQIGNNWTDLATRAYVLLALGRNQEADRLLTEAIRLRPRSPELLMMRAEHALESGDLDAALAWLDGADEAATLSEATPARGTETRITVVRARAHAYEHAGRNELALDTLHRARELAVELASEAQLALLYSDEIRLLTALSRIDAAQALIEKAALHSRQASDRGARHAALLATADLELATFRTRLALERVRAVLQSAADTGDERGLERALYRLAIAALDRGEYLEALPYLNECVERARRSGDLRTEQRATVGRARAHLLLADHQEGLQLATRALEMAGDAGDLHGQCVAHLATGQASYRLGALEAADDHYAAALSIAEKHGYDLEFGRTLVELGLVADALGQVEMAHDWFHQALEVAARTQSVALLVDCKAQLAEGSLELGDYESALSGFGEALELATEAGYLEGRWSNLTFIGEVHKFLGDHPRAISYFKEALRLSEATHNRVAQASNLKHLGEVFSLLNDYDTSLRYLSRSLRTNRTTRNALGEGDALLAMCQTLNASGHFASARDRGLEVLRLAEQRGHLSWLARASVELGSAYLGLDELDIAHSYFERGRSLAIELGRPSLEWPADIGLARVLSGGGDSDAAIIHAREAVGGVERMRSSLNLPERRESFLEDRLEPYEQLVMLLIQKGDLAEAFSVMEYSRSRAFLEILSHDDDESPELMRLREQEIWLGREITRTTQRLATASASAEHDSATAAVLRTLKDLRQRQDKIRAMIGPEQPTAAILTGARPLGLSEIQAMISPSEALIEYYVTRDDLVTFVITNDSVSALTRKESQSHLEARVKLFRDAISEPGRTVLGEPDWLGPSNGLFTVLIAPLRDDPAIGARKTLTIVPHKFLHYVPFHALIDRRSLDGRFLVEDYDLSYAPSASVLGHCIDSDPGTLRSAMALANPRPTDLATQALPFARSEATLIQQLFGDRALVAVGDDATETLAKSASAGIDLLHFATHYNPDWRDPLSSSLELAPSDADDGDLNVREVMELRIDASLVVLSGCSTAGERSAHMPGSDDWVNLTRAFIYAGAPSVVATLWPIQDRPSWAFMSRFYAALPEHSKSHALCTAQRDLLAGGTADRYRDPYYWAPFVLVGSGR